MVNIVSGGKSAGPTSPTKNPPAPHGMALLVLEYLVAQGLHECTPLLAAIRADIPASSEQNPNPFLKDFLAVWELPHTLFTILNILRNTEEQLLIGITTCIHTTLNRGVTAFVPPNQSLLALLQRLAGSSSFGAKHLSKERNCIETQWNTLTQSLANHLNSHTSFTQLRDLFLQYFIPATSLGNEVFNVAQNECLQLVRTLRQGFNQLEQGAQAAAAWRVPDASRLESETMPSSVKSYLQQQEHFEHDLLALDAPEGPQSPVQKLQLKTSSLEKLSQAIGSLSTGYLNLLGTLIREERRAAVEKDSIFEEHSRIHLNFAYTEQLCKELFLEGISFEIANKLRRDLFQMSCRQKIRADDLIDEEIWSLAPHIPKDVLQRTRHQLRYTSTDFILSVAHREALLQHLEQIHFVHDFHQQRVPHPQNGAP